MFDILFTIAIICETFFMSISDAGFRSLIESNCKFILFIVVCRAFIGIISVMLEFRQKKVKQGKYDYKNEKLIFTEKDQV